ncbi:MAG: penicillin-binding protein 2 [Candidatus Paceibacterota bacterium]
MKFSHIGRIRAVSIIIIIFAFFIIGKLYVVQIVEGDTYSEKADRQYSSSGGSLFTRASIFFQSKDGELVSAATLKSGYIIAVNPQIIKNPEEAYNKLNEIFPINKEDFLAKATKVDDPYEEIAKRVDEEVGLKVADLKISGLNIYKDRWRFYPGGNIAAHTLGFMGYSGNDFAGRYGLERFYENNLERKPTSYINFFAQVFANISDDKINSNSGDIVTSIEPTLQLYLQEELASTTEKWNSEYTGGIIMNPKTGEIYAMSIDPSFDPNDPQSQKSSVIFSNKLVEDVYEMGSIIKPLTVAMGIDMGLILPSSTYYDSGSVMVSGKKISNFDGKERGVVTIQEALSESLNVGMVHIAKLVGNDKQREYFYNFGLNQKTNIDLPNESANLVKNLESPRDIEHATASFGQGIAMTPISTIRALATIANGGVLVEPHLVKTINYKTGLSKNYVAPPVTRVIKPETAEEVTRMMVYSVDNVLLGGKAKIENYSVAVKTGTAQIAKPGGGGYSETDVLHSFVGFVPAYDPQFFIFLYTVKPKGIRFSSETLTLPFFDIVKFVINYYELTPDR